MTTSLLRKRLRTSKPGLKIAEATELESVLPEEDRIHLAFIVRHLEQNGIGRASAIELFVKLSAWSVEQHGVRPSEWFPNK